MLCPFQLEPPTFQQPPRPASQRQRPLKQCHYPETILLGENHVTVEGSGRQDAKWGEKELKKDQDGKHMDEEIILEVGCPAPAAATRRRSKLPCRALPKSMTRTKIRWKTKWLFQATRFSDSLLYNNRKIVHVLFCFVN